jgi:hypothetical protein
VGVAPGADGYWEDGVSRLRQESEKIICIAYRVDQGRYSDPEIAYMYGTTIDLVREVRAMTKHISDQKYQKSTGFYRLEREEVAV